MTGVAINFLNASLSETCTVSLGAGADPGSSEPVVQVSGFSGSATLARPAGDGPQIRSLQPGVEVTLTGFTG
jgi:hypothetical protein